MGEKCMCGHSKDEHGGDPDFPGHTGCNDPECDCIAYEADEDSDDED